MLFRSWHASYRVPATSGGGYVAIGSTMIDGVVFDGYIGGGADRCGAAVGLRPAIAAARARAITES